MGVNETGPRTVLADSVDWLDAVLAPLHDGLLKSASWEGDT